MSKGNWSEWLGAAHDASSTAQTPNYVALTDDTLHHPSNPSAIPALSNTNYRYPYHHYHNPTTPSTSHYGQQQYNTPYYQPPYHNTNYNNSNSNSNNSNSLCPPPDYYASIKNKHKKHKKHKNKNKRNKEISVPPARPPKPKPISTISNNNYYNISVIKQQYELIVSNVPLQIRSRELHNALNKVKCHLTDFYIPDYSEASTIIIVVKGFVQWRQLSKLTEIEIRGVMCPITPKPLKSLKKNNENENENHHKRKDDDNDDNDESDKEKAVNVIMNEENKKKEENNNKKQKLKKEIKKENNEKKNEIKVKEEGDNNELNEDIDLIAHLNELQNVIPHNDTHEILRRYDNDNNKNINNNNNNNDIEINYSDNQNENTSKSSNINNINNQNINVIINTDNNTPQLTEEIAIDHEHDNHQLHNDNENTNENTAEDDHYNNQNMDSNDKNDVFNIKLEVPDVPDIIMSDDQLEREQEHEQKQEQEQEEDMYFVDDNNTDTYNDLNELMQQEQPPIQLEEKEEQNELTQIKNKRNVFQPLNTDKKKQIAKDKLQKALNSAREKKQSISISSLSSIKHSPQKLNHIHNKINLQKALNSDRKKKKSLPPIQIQSININKSQKQKHKQNKPQPISSQPIKQSPPKFNHMHNKLHNKNKKMKKLISNIKTKNNIKNAYKPKKKINIQNKPHKTQHPLKYNSKSKSMKLDKNNKSTITIPRTSTSTNKCAIKYETRSMFMSKLVELSCNYHNGMSMIQFKSIALKIEDIMQQHCQTTLTYKLSCGQLLKQYRQLQNIHKLCSFCKQQYGIDNKIIKPQTPIERLLLTKEQLEDNGYPIKTEYLDDEYKDFVVTPHNKRRNMYDLLAIDCEMCKTTVGSELTRISIVDAKLMVVYDKLVKPPHEIIDYLTEWSGITENLLKGVQRTITDVQEEIFAFMNADTILCGHSLENDLIAMKLIHYKVVDTAVLFMKRMRFRNNKRNIGYSIGSGGGRKLSLKHLCEQYLNKSIQCAKGPDGQVVGHSSVEDAISAMQLLQLQLKWEEERNRKLGIGVPESITQYVVYGKDNKMEVDEDINGEDDVEGVYDDDDEEDEEERNKQLQKEMIRRKKKILNRRYANAPIKQKRFEYNGKVKGGIDLHALYGSNKKTKIDSSKQRFNPNAKELCEDNALLKISKEEMLSNLFEDDLFLDKGKKLKTENSNAIMDIECDNNSDSDSEDLVILAPSKLKNIENKTKSMQAIEISSAHVQSKSRGKKRKLEDNYNNDDHSPSKLKTKRRKLVLDHSNNNNNNNFNFNFNNNNSSNKDNSYSNSDSDLNDIINIPSPPPSPHVFNNESLLEEDNFDDYHTDIIALTMSDDENDINQDKYKGKKRDRKKDKKHKKSKKHKKHKEKKSKSKSSKHHKSRSRSKSKDKNLGKAKAIVLEWCHKYLNPLFKQQQITRKEYTAIAKKSVNKILQSHDIWTSQNIKNLQTKSKHKVMDVIKAYVKKQTRAN